MKSNNIIFIGFNLMLKIFISNLPGLIENIYTLAISFVRVLNVLCKIPAP